MPYCNANGMRLYYEMQGPKRARSAPTLLLIMGVGAQLIAWPDAFCQDFVDRGWRVLRFDNRDVGLSQQCDELGTPDIAQIILRLTLGTPVYPPYELGDMARDALALLQALGIERAHVVGASMGGMIAQIMTATHPEHVASLSLIMTTSGAPRLPRPSMEVMSISMARPQDASDLGALRDWYYRFLRSLEGSRHPQPADELRAFIERSIARAYTPRGTARQSAAILAGGDRSALLRLIEVPTLVIHGDEDPLTHIDGGRDLARKIPGARLVVIPGMGHTLPEPLLPEIADLVDGHARSTAWLMTQRYGAVRPAQGA